MSISNTQPPANFIRQRIDIDLAENQIKNVVTRFPPEPNGYLHIGHAKSICLNFGIAKDYEGHCFLRFDDTNPEKEAMEFVKAIQEDVKWLGFDWEDRLRHASDYFEQLFQYAVELIKSEKAYVCSLDGDAIRQMRGTLTEPGQDSPYRKRTVDENLDLFLRMRDGEFKDGAHVLRAKIDMSSPNLNMRDPIIYRVRHQHHQNTGDTWCIYPMYDFTHCLSDAIEGITHSLCTLEFEDHRPLYDWVLDNVSAPCHPQQIEFSRLTLNYTVTSKRLLAQLVNDGHVEGWDDPRMPTISGLRRRGFTPEAIRDFCDRIGITKKYNQIEMTLLENLVREDLDPKVNRRMAVLNPIKLVVTNYPDDLHEIFDAPNHPNKPEMGTRTIEFGKELVIERDDFMIDPPRKFFRMGPGREVRLRYAYIVTCTGFDVDENGEPSVIYCTYDPETKGGNTPDGRKVKGTIHWVSSHDGQVATVHLYDRLFTEENPAGSKARDFKDHLNPESLRVLSNAIVEPSVVQGTSIEHFQFERLGYFCTDPKTSTTDLVINRTISLRDTWSAQKGHKK
jgi:glutaminyl-tRNA synthetase